MKTPAPLVHRSPSAEYFFVEGCFITEWWNAPADDAVSVARARVKPGVTTRWHRLRGVTERYLILEGRGRVEVGDLPPEDVGPGAVVLIPPGVRQRIANPDDGDLLFLAICTPRFTPAIYEDLGSDCGPHGVQRAKARIATRQEDPAHEPHGTD
jgi:mannose-6-phosphate isomerase-like protein (cupin superfamily)